MSEPYDMVFSLPAVDDDAGTEIGVLLMGFGPERLLAGLGVASGGLVGDAATATLYVDQLRHGARDDHTIADAVAAGARRWRAVDSRLAEVGVGAGAGSAALRQQWKAAAAALVTAGGVLSERGTISEVERIYLVACWLRRDEIGRVVEELCPT